jgi:hypothetical protein
MTARIVSDEVRPLVLSRLAETLPPSSAVRRAIERLPKRMTREQFAIQVQVIGTLIESEFGTEAGA